MPSTLQNFTLSAIAAPDDFIVGYDTATLNGERRWSVSTIANAVSGIMKEELQSLVTEQTITLSAPTGSVIYYSLSAAPTGWIECNGAALSASMGPSYTDLRTLLINNGYKFGADSNSNPKIPDLRGRFIRSSGSDGTYSSGTFGTKQGDLLRNHTHSGTTGGESQSHTHGYNNYPPNRRANPSGSPATMGDDPVAQTSGLASQGHTHDFTTGDPNGSLGGSETRPANVALLACIKL